MNSIRNASILVAALALLSFNCTHTDGGPSSCRGQSCDDPLREGGSTSSTSDGTDGRQQANPPDATGGTPEAGSRDETRSDPGPDTQSDAPPLDLPGDCDSFEKASYLGCEYWAVDLPNTTVVNDWGLSPMTATWAVAIGNSANVQVSVNVYRSAGGRGEQLVAAQTVAAGQVGIIEMPESSVSGTFQGFTAYRIETSHPVAAYQFNPLNNTDAAYSNDASLLIPTRALGSEYIAVTEWSAVNPELPMPAFVSIVGVSEEPVDVVVELAHDLEPNDLFWDRQERLEVTLNQYEVLQLADEEPRIGQAGLLLNVRHGMTGTRITSTGGPVAVFSGNTSAIALSLAVEQSCCADHLEEQLWPVQSWGMQYVLSPFMARTQTPTTERWTVVASRDGTEIHTTPIDLPVTPMFDDMETIRYLEEEEAIVLDRGESVFIESPHPFVLSASQPVLVSHHAPGSHHTLHADLPMVPCEVDFDDPSTLACEGLTGLAFCEPFDRPNDGPGYCRTHPTLPWVDCDPSSTSTEPCTAALGTLSLCQDWGDDGARCEPIGDPAMTLVPPIGQYRDEYVFLTPLDYRWDFAVVTAPAGANVWIDDVLVPQELWTETLGLNDDAWWVSVVPVEDGWHRLTSDRSVGVLVGGYDLHVSYGYPAGLDLITFDDNTE